MKPSRILFAVAIACLLASSHVLSQATSARQGATPTPPTATGARAGKEADLLPAEPVLSQHTGRFNGQTVVFTTEVGWLPIRDEGKVVAKMFYVAYTKNGVTDPSTKTRLSSVSSILSFQRRLMPICEIASFGFEDTGNCPDSEYTSKS